MKKIGCLVLVFVISFTLFACGATKTENKIYGKWVWESQTLVLNEEYTGELIRNGVARPLTWKYDEASHLVVITLSDSGSTDEATYMEADDTLYIDGATFVRVSE